MKEQSISKAYASALFSLGKEKNIKVADELTVISELIGKSSDLENVLFLEVFTPEEKTSVLNAIMKKLKTSSIVQHFLNFLVEAKRINLLPVIFKDLIVLDDHDSGFLRGTIEGYESEVNEGFKSQIVSYLKKRLNKDINLSYIENNEITAGYKVTVEDLQLDASLDSQLNELKNSVLNS